MSLLARVQAYIQEHDLLRPGARVLVACSGGPDSLCLLDTLSALAGEWRMALQVAYLDHGLRTEAAAEAGFVRQQAEARGWPFHSGAVDTRAHAAAHKQSVEEAARALRYAFLARVAGQVGADAIAVAHNADDQAETVLMHFLRGSGLAGLRGMLPKTVTSYQSTVIGLVRPLLATTRAEIEAYCAERGLRPLLDVTNLDTTIFRNRLRHELLPELETYNPNVREVLRRAAEVAAGEHALLQALIADLWRRVVRAEGLQVEFDRARWQALAAPEQTALLREAVHRLRPEERDVDYKPITQAVRFSRMAVPGRSCDVLGGLRLKVTTEAVVLSPWDYRPIRADLPLLTPEGSLARPWRFVAEALKPGAWSLAEVEANADPWRVCVDASQACEWRLRARRPGDRFHPLGLGGHTIKLSDFLINARIDESLRDRWPLVVCGDEVVWVAGLRLDERFKLTAKTQRVVRLMFVREVDA